MTLGNRIFFDPLPVFIDFLKSLEPKPAGFVDVGAGVGRMSRVMAEHGLKVLAIDICQREETEFPVQSLDALTLTYPANCVPIIARPCHGHWLDFAIERALETAPYVLYVGLPKNVENDLGALRDDYIISHPAMGVTFGTEGEIVCRIELSKAL